MEEELFEDTEMGSRVKGGIEGEDGSGAFETVSCEVEFFHGVYLERLVKVLKMHDRDKQFCMCILTVGPLGALLIHKYRSFPFRASKKKTLLQL